MTDHVSDDLTVEELDALRKQLANSKLCVRDIGAKRFFDNEAIVLLPVLERCDKALSQLHRLTAAGGEVMPKCSNCDGIWATEIEARECCHEPSSDDLQRRIYATAALTGMCLGGVASDAAARAAWYYADAMLIEQHKREGGQ